MLWPSWDRSVFLTVNGIDSPALTWFMRTLTNVDNWIPVLVILVAGLLWLGRTRPIRQPSGGRLKRAIARRNPRIVILCLILATAASDQACYHLKRYSARPRPCFDDSISHLVDYRGDVHGNRSFPSAHAANSAALATTLSLAYPPVAPFAAAVAFLVGFSRIYLGVHYPLDVLAGWLIGMLSAAVVWLLLRKRAGRQGIIGFTNRFRYRQPAPDTAPPQPWSEVPLQSLDGYAATGYLRRGREGLVVLVHGLHGSIASMTRPGDIFAELGFSVLVVPLRGHDGHPVPVTSGGPEEVQDLAGALEWASGELGVPRSRTIVYGSSMGGATALKLAGLLGEEVAAVIAHGAYSDFFLSARSRMGRLRTFLLKLFLPPGVRLGLRDFSPADYAGRCRTTRFVYITGELDRISPPGTSVILSGITGGPVIVLEGSGHPVWDRPDWNRAQTFTALREAAGFATGRSPVDLSIDDRGTVTNRPASSGNRTGREK